MTGDMTRQLVDVVLKDDTSMYETVLQERTFRSGTMQADMMKYRLDMVNDEISYLMEHIPEEYAQDLHTAWEAVSRVISKMKGERK